MSKEIAIVEQTTDHAAMLQERANIDSQVATAMAFPRNLLEVKRNGIAIATMDGETAEACIYTIMKGGKSITGPSVVLARILAAEYGHIRVESGLLTKTSTEVICYGMAWDLQKNIAVRDTVPMSILTKNGTVYSQDMIVTTIRAAAAKAERNAIYKVIPAPIVDAIMKEVQAKIKGEITAQGGLIAATEKMFAYFFKTYGASEAQVLKAVNLKNKAQVDENILVVFRGLANSLKIKEQTPDEVFGFSSASEHMPDLKKDPKPTAQAEKAPQEPQQAPQNIAPNEQFDAEAELPTEPGF